MTLDDLVERVARALLAKKPGVTPSLEGSRLYAEPSGFTLHDAVMAEARAALAEIAAAAGGAENLRNVADALVSFGSSSDEGVAAVLVALAEAAEAGR